MCVVHAVARRTAAPFFSSSFDCRTDAHRPTPSTPSVRSPICSRRRASTETRGPSSQGRPSSRRPTRGNIARWKSATRCWFWGRFVKMFAVMWVFAIGIWEWSREIIFANWRGLIRAVSLRTREGWSWDWRDIRKEVRGSEKRIL